MADERVPEAVERNGASRRGGGPTRASAAVVFVASLAAAVGLIAGAGPTLSLVVAVAHAAVFAASLWLVDRDRWRGAAAAAAGVLALGVGASFAVAVGYTFLDLLAAAYPVPEVSQIRARGLRIVSATAVVLGGTLALVGGFATVSGRLRSETVWSYAKLAVETFVVPLTVAALMLLTALLARLGGASEAPVFAPLAEGAGGAVGAVVAPVPGRTHLLTFALLVGAASLAVARGVDALPVAELSTPRTDDRVEATADAVGRGARRALLVTTFALPVTLIEVVLAPSDLRSLVPPGVYGLLAAVTASHGLRALLLATALVAGGTAAAVWLLGRLARADAADAVVALTPFLGGGAVVALAVALHGVVLPPTLSFVADALPGQFETAFARQSGAVVEFYGSLPVVTTLAAVLVGMTAVLSLALALVTSTGALPESAPGPALAAAGVFVAAAFATGAGVGAPLVLGGIVASFVVWDAGEYGATLAREVGPTADTFAPESVHVGATLAVGVGGAVSAAAVHRIAANATIADATTVPFALAVVVAGLLLLVAALR
ncbi:hypothetical protein C475_09264 [Halosimplex carlsbadense 2-9-1]|uniref:Uncharacterized protein n=1 Tax=Halosimplex carlsbadense 2-9-1 TaxID=797114 RepID=M0CQY6_9EURY|nr:hypothetical protein [Halosimplex carlsbadense]ELZ25636.1 hypothetical protein C475_09264 [Halosimplex carlsbadense 2-9-1]